MEFSRKFLEFRNNKIKIKLEEPRYNKIKSYKMELHAGFSIKNLKVNFLT
jgi:hypothetical protein